MQPEIRPGLITALLGPRAWDAGAALRELLAAVPESVLVRSGARELMRTRSPEEGQRLALERELGGGAKALFLEQPARGLEPFLQELVSEHTVVIATHDLSQAARLAGRTAVFDADGGLLEEGETARVLASPADDRAEAYLRAESGSGAARAPLDGFEARLGQAGGLVLRVLRGALDALVQRDIQLADDATILAREVGQARLQIAEGMRDLLALQILVAADLRLALAIQCANLELGLIAEDGAAIANQAKLVADVEPDPLLLQSLAETGERAEEMIRLALNSFAQRDLDAARSLTGLPDSGFVERAVEIVGEPGKREWLLRMALVAGALQRIGDRALAIADQVADL